MFTAFCPSSRLAFGCLAIATVALSACSGVEELFARPPKSAGSAPPLPTNDSQIGGRITVPLAALKPALEQAVPSQYKGAMASEACAKVGLGSMKTKNCVDLKGDYTVQRGSFSVEQVSATSLRFAVPLDVSGDLKVRGRGSADKLVIEVLKLRNKNVKGSGALRADMSFSLTEDWCLNPSVKLDMAWSRTPKVEAFNNVWLDVGGLVKPAVDASLSSIESQIRKSIPCEAVRTEVAKILTPRSVPVDLPDNMGRMFVNFRPTAVAFSGTVVTPEAVSFALQVGAQVDVAPTASSAALLPLPPLKTISAADALRLRLAVPVRVRYDMLQAAAQSELAGKIFEVETPVGRAKVKLFSVEIYPSGGRLAIGVKAALDVPGRLFDVKGDVYLLAAPKVTGTVVSLKDIGFAQVLDNKGWDLVSLVLRDRIIMEIGKAVRYDVAKDAGRVQGAIVDAIAKAATNGLSLKPVNPSMGLGEAALTAETLEIEGLFEATIDATATQLVSR